MNKHLTESELILRDDGSIYHLALKPEELAPLVVVVGDPGRVDRVSKYFDKIEFKKAHREFVTHTGYIGKQRISVISTGIGTDNIDIVLNELDALVNLDFAKREIKKQLQQLTIVRIGTAGGLQAESAVDSFVVNDFALGFDSLLHYYHYQSSEEESALLAEVQNHFQQLTIQPYVAKGNRQLIDLFADDCQVGMTATCCGFYAPQGRALRAQLAYKDILQQIQDFSFLQSKVVNFEMETAGLYGLSNILQHRSCSLSAIIANRTTGEFSKDYLASVDKLIQLALEKLLKPIQ